MKIFRLIIILFICSTLGCVFFSKNLIVTDFPSINQVIERLEDRRCIVENFIMQGEITSQGAQGEVLGEYRIFGRFPDNLRVEIIGPFGSPALFMVTDGLRLIALVYSESKGFIGSATRENLERFLGIALTPAEIYMILIGSIPLLNSNNKGELTLLKPNVAMLQINHYFGAEKVNIVFNLVDYTVYEVKLYQIKEENELIELTYYYDSFIDLFKHRFPQCIRIVSNKHKLFINNNILRINQKLDNNLFKVDIKSEFKLQKLS